MQFVVYNERNILKRTDGKRSSFTYNCNANENTAYDAKKYDYRRKNHHQNIAWNVN